MGTLIRLVDETGIERFRGTQSPGGGSVPGQLLSKDYTFTETDAQGPSYAITAVDLLLNTVTIAGDHAAEFVHCDWLQITGSTGNDGVLEIESAVAGGGSTVITLGDTLSDATADGLVWPSSYRADFAIPEGATLVGISIWGVAAWAADNFTIFAFDTTQSYISGSFIQGPPNWAAPGSTMDKWGDAPGEIALSSPFLTGAGAGRYYDADDTLTVTMLVVTAGGAPTGTGVNRVKVWYFAPVTAVASSAP